MHFRTQIPILKSDHQIDYNSKVVSLGSCFAVNISEKLDYYKFQNTVNPFGILFHPAAIEKFIGFAINQRKFTDADVFFHNERWHCFDAHSELSRTNKEELTETLNSNAAAANKQITESTHIIITLGTAWVYRNNASGDVVANCHKIPQKNFTKHLMSIDEIKKSLE